MNVRIEFSAPALRLAMARPRGVADWLERDITTHQPQRVETDWLGQRVVRCNCADVRRALAAMGPHRG